MSQGPLPDSMTTQSEVIISFASSRYDCTFILDWCTDPTHGWSSSARAQADKEPARTELRSTFNVERQAMIAYAAC